MKIALGVSFDYKNDEAGLADVIADFEALLRQRSGYDYSGYQNDGRISEVRVLSAAIVGRVSDAADLVADTTSLVD